MATGLDLLGAPSPRYIGIDWGGILKGAGDLGTAGVAAYQSNEADNKSKAETQAALEKVKSADVDAAVAMAQAYASLKGAGATASAAPAAGTPSAQKAAADKAAADVATAAQDRAAAGLPSSAIADRVAAAQAQLALAVGKLQVAPGSAYAEGLVKAWQMTIAKAQNSQIVLSASGSAGGAVGGDSFWVRPVLGPIPGWGVVVGGTGVVGILGLVARKLLLRGR